MPEEPESIEGESEEELPAGRELPMRLEPGELPGRYATNLAVQHTEHEFTISFFEARPPITLGTPEEVAKQLDEIEYIGADCVARIIVAAGRMPSFVETLETNLKRYLDHFGE